LTPDVSIKIKVNKKKLIIMKKSELKKIIKETINEVA
jgi:hypothetical protein